MERKNQVDLSCLDMEKIVAVPSCPSIDYSFVSRIFEEYNTKVTTMEDTETRQYDAIRLFTTIENACFGF